MFDIPKLTDLKYADLLSRAQSRAFQESQGKLNDFSRNNPLYVLVSVLAWSGSEILYFANKFAERLAFKFLSLLADTTGESGSRATTTIKVTLTIATLLEIPKGTRIQGTFQNRVVIFSTDDNLLFNGSTLELTVSCSALEIGSLYTIPTGVLNRFTQPISFIADVTNITPATGFDPLTRDESVELALERIRSRALVSENDFIFYCNQALGVGGITSVIPNLSADRSRFELGSVHCFLLDGELNPASEFLIGQVRTELFKNNPPMAGINLYFSPMEILEIRIEIIANISNDATFFGIAESIYSELKKYLSSKTHKPGDEFNIRLFESRLWLIPGIINFEPISINDGNTSISVSKQTKIVAQYVSCTLINVDNVTQEILIGAGESVYN